MAASPPLSPSPHAASAPDARALDAQALDTLFREARSQNGWSAAPVAEGLIERTYELVRLGPTSLNCSPARFLLLRTPTAKERLRPALAPGNLSKVLSAPVVVIIGHDLHFYDRLPTLFPHRSVDAPFRADAALAERTAFRNGTLQGAYLMIAARALGLDCAPISGFNNALVDTLFFGDGHVRSNFICGLGYGDPAAVFPRLPRLTFAEACTTL